MTSALHTLKLAVGHSLWAIVALSLITAAGLYMDFGAATAAVLFLVCVTIQAKRGDFWSAAIVATVATFSIAFFFTRLLFHLASPIRWMR